MFKIILLFSLLCIINLCNAILEIPLPKDKCKDLTIEKLCTETYSTCAWCSTTSQCVDWDPCGNKPHKARKNNNKVCEGAPETHHNGWKVSKNGDSCLEKTCFEVFYMILASLFIILCAISLLACSYSNISGYIKSKFGMYESIV